MQYRVARPYTLPLLLVLLTLAAHASAQNGPDRPDKLDSILKKRASLGNGQSRVIIRKADDAADADVAALVSLSGGSNKKKLANIAASKAEVPGGDPRNSFQINTPQNAAIIVAPWPSA